MCCDLLQGYQLDDEATSENGREVFSLMRVSELDQQTYLDTFFDTGSERTGYL